MGLSRLMDEDEYNEREELYRKTINDRKRYSSCSCGCSFPHLGLSFDNKEIILTCPYCGEKRFFSRIFYDGLLDLDPIARTPV